ncbi:cytochrome P450 [Longispora fulva]|uniref:Cytochrome P450 n=1 Tax=Longispora fulva TaxID=619741 RepID=A0A8J7GFB0_9ACTN|nr:cytochrome P450 [Longispora fulva]MBG6134828.1 hypothetical protein [Longispora fulva]
MPDTLRFAALRLGPALARGRWLPQRWAARLTGRHGAVRRSTALLDRFRDRYGDAVRVRGPRGPVLVLLTPAAVRRVLGDPVPGAGGAGAVGADVGAGGSGCAGDAVRRGGAAGGRPDGGLALSWGAASRAGDRRFPGDVADRHPRTDAVRRVICEEAGRLVAARAVLTWAVFQNAVDRMARRIVLGDPAAGDTEVTGLYLELGAEGHGSRPPGVDAAWPGARRRAERALAVRERLADRLGSYLDAAVPGGVAEAAIDPPRCAVTGGGTDTGREKVVGQVAHWFLAFDILAGVALTTLVVLAGERDLADRARKDPDVARACVLETLRLWPPARDLFRDSCREVDWGGEVLPAGTRLLVPAVFGHGDRRTVAEPDAFLPDLRDPSPEAGFFPFDLGEPVCAGRDLGVLMTTELVGQLLDRAGFRLLSAGLPVRGPLPRVLDPGAFRLAVSER